MGKEGRSRKLYVNAGVSIVLTFLLAYILRAKIHTWSWLYIGIAIFLFIIFNEISQDKKQRNSKVTFFMGWIFAVMYLLGVVLEDSALTVSNLIVTMILGNIGGVIRIYRTKIK